MTHPVLEHLSRFRVRWAVAAGVAVAAVALTAFAVGGGDADVADGARLNIAVVPPVERDVQPGDIMEVGRLNDGFDGRMPERVEQTSSDVDLYAEQPAYVEDDRGWQDDRRPDRYDSRPTYDDDQSRTDERDRREHSGGQPYQERPMSFGFDQPRPDWRAEREARRAALDARERDARRERRYRSDGGSAGLSQDSEFY